jgi:hypothetical protein
VYAQSWSLLKIKKSMEKILTRVQSLQNRIYIYYFWYRNILFLKEPQKSINFACLATEALNIIIVDHFLIYFHKLGNFAFKSITSFIGTNIGLKVHKMNSYRIILVLNTNVKTSKTQNQQMESNNILDKLQVWFGWMFPRSSCVWHSGWG